MNNRVVALSAAICALLISGVAFAQKVPGGSVLSSSGAPTNSPEGTPTVTIQIPVNAVTRELCVFATPNPLNVQQTVFLGSGAVITGLGGSGTLTAFDPSWLSEASVMFRGAVVAEVIRLRPISGTNAPGIAVPFNVAPIDLTANALPNITLGAAGNLTIEFCETFNDAEVNPDGQFLAGSFITVQCFNCFDPFGEPPLAAPINSPWAMISLLLGLGLVGGIAVRRFS